MVEHVAGTRDDLPVDPDLDEEGSKAAERPQRAAVVGVVAAAGAVGALARYGISEAWPVAAGHFPWPTFVVNVSGSLLIGLVLVLLLERFPAGHLARLLAVSGFLGAYTTFSTYVVGVVLLWRHHDVLTGTAYALGSLGAGLAAAAVGIAIGRGAIHLDRVVSEVR